MTGPVPVVPHVQPIVTLSASTSPSRRSPSYDRENTSLVTKHWGGGLASFFPSYGRSRRKPSTPDSLTDKVVTLPGRPPRHPGTPLPVPGPVRDPSTTSGPPRSRVGSRSTGRHRTGGGKDPGVHRYMCLHSPEPDHGCKRTPCLRD